MKCFFQRLIPIPQHLYLLFFCSAFIFRPFGALLFGWIGDNIGRKATVIITTMLMAVSCIIMANLPTYAQIGITAAWFLTFCRIIQGMSSMGEIIGAQIFMTEIIKPPARYPVVALTEVFADFGGFAALAVASLCTVYAFNWRVAFWVGACIAVIGSVARTRLRESPEFLKEKEKKQRKDYNPAIIEKKTMLAYFFIQSGWPVCFYFSYVYCGDLLTKLFQYSSDQIIHNNLVVSLVQLVSSIFFVALSVRFHPLKILKVVFWIFMAFIVICPYLMFNLKTPYHLFFVQCFPLFFGLGVSPANAVFFKYFPTLKRFTSISLIYSTSRAVMYVITSFGLVTRSNFMISGAYWSLFCHFVSVIVGVFITLKSLKDKVEIIQKGTVQNECSKMPHKK